MIKPLLKRMARRLGNVLNTDMNLRRCRATRLYQELVLRQENSVRQLQDDYAALLNAPEAKARLRSWERKFYSQNGEDGLLLHLFALVGAPHKTFIEFGIEDGSECNAANLAINFGWNGLLIEGSPTLAERARQFYHQRHGRAPREVQVASQFLTVDNVNQVFVAHGFQGELGLLSIDIDGNDYWIWKGIETVTPRVVVVEYNASFGPDHSITVPYDPAFDRYLKHPSGWYHGAALAALAKLARGRGYVLVGCDSAGANAFFVQADLARGRLPELSVAEAFYPSAPRLREASQAEQFARIKHLEYIEI